MRGEKGGDKHDGRSSKKKEGEASMHVSKHIRKLLPAMAVVAISIALVVVAGGCGAEEPTATSVPPTATAVPPTATTAPVATATPVAAGPTATPTSAPIPTPSEKIKTGGMLKYAMNPNVEHVFYMTYSGGAAAAWAMTVGDPIMAYGPDAEWRPEKSMTESYEVADDGLSVKFHLKKGIKFHDGTDYNAQAQKYSLEWCLDPDTPTVTASAVEAISEIEVVDDYTLIIRTEEVFAPLLTNLGMTAGMPFSPTAFEEMGLDRFQSEGGPSTGPFMVGEWVAGSEITFYRHPEYHQEGKPYLDGWIWVEIPDDRVRAAALQAGEVDVVFIDSSAFDSIKALRNSDALELKLYEGPRMSHFNAARAPFDDIRVRKAAQMAIDRHAWNEVITGGEGKVYSGSVLPPGHAAAYEVDPYPYAYNPQEAKRLLEEYAAEKGLSLPIDTLEAFTCTPEQKEMGCQDLPERKITLTAAGTRQDVTRGEFEKAMYEAVGFKVEMDMGSGNEAARTFVTKEATFSMRGYGVRPHPSGSFNSYMGYGGYWNQGGWNTAPEQMELDRVVREAAQTFDMTEQVELYKEAQRIYMEYVLGGVRLAAKPTFHFAAPYVKWERYPDQKWIKYPSDVNLKIHDVWLDQ